MQSNHDNPVKFGKCTPKDRRMQVKLPIPLVDLSFLRRIAIACMSLALFLGNSTVLVRAQQPSPVSKASAIRASLLVRADADCNLSVDGGPPVSLSASTLKTMRVSLGDHVLAATLPDGSFRWEAVVSLERPVQKAVLIDIGQQKAAAEALALQRQQQEAEVKARAERAQAELQQAHERQVLLQKQLQEQRDKISQQIRDLQAQRQAEITAAERNEKQAADARTQAALYGMAGWGAPSSLSQLGANQYLQSAQQHRLRAQALQQQIVMWSQQLANLED